jgi:arylsulfatase A-like enzyme
MKLFLLLSVLSGAILAGAPSRPNIVLILADDMGYADCGAYGLTDFKTPAIDSIAAGGVRCTNGYVTAPVCSPSRAGLMTGRYQQRFGHELNLGDGKAPYGLPVTETVFAQRLKAAGYATGLVGKWHLGGHAQFGHAQFHPNARGFDTFFGFLMGQRGYFPGPLGERESPIERNGTVLEEKEYLTDAFGREAADFIERSRTRPFFLYLAFNAPHVPLHATPRDLARVPHLEGRRQIYAAMMLAMDDAIGRVLAKLREHGLEENTLVFFLSDNGGPPGNGSNNGPLRGFKGDTLEGGLRVPYLVKWPARLPAGRTFDPPVSALDVSATALSAAGIEIRSDWKLDGVDLVPFLGGQNSASPHAALFWRFGQQMALRFGDEKIARGNLEAPLALFNVVRDIGEKSDLAAAAPDLRNELNARWRSWSSELVKPLWGDPAKAGTGAKQ